MDFYTHQDAARKKTRQLVMLFALAVTTLVAITNLLVAVTYHYVLRGGKVVTHQFSAQDLVTGPGWQTYVTVSLVVIAVVLGAIGFKWLTLSAGGKAVADALQGRLVEPNTSVAAERRLINVVEEMAIASGLPVPPVYLLAQEPGINAFAAGNTPADAVIGITRGAIERLDREQLQGVIAHEFSHIQNGDMRLNLRLVAVLFGILFIGMAGRSLLHGDPRLHMRHALRRGGISTDRRVVLGVGLVTVGWLGSFFGNWIKAAVSRQREFLADASAVQFTRNPDGLANALRIIGGSTVRSELQAVRAEQFSHLFFGNALHGGRLFATHPPLQQRIRRIKPDWDGSFIVENADYEITAVPAVAHDTVSLAAGTAAVVQPAHVVDAVTDALHALPVAAAQSMLRDIPQPLRQICGEPLEAVGVVLGLLLSHDTGVRSRQLAHIALCEMPGLVLLAQQHADNIARLAPQQRLPLLELCLPALKQMSVDQYKRVRRVLLLVIRADGRLDLAEWCVLQLVCHFVEPALGLARTSRPHYRDINDIAAEFAQVLSMLAWSGHRDAPREVVENAFRRGADAAGISRIALCGPAACRIDDFTRATTTLADAYPLLKPRLLKGLAECARHDEVIAPLERELIHAIAAVIDCPLPPLDSSP